MVFERIQSLSKKEFALGGPIDIGPPRMSEDTVSAGLHGIYELNRPDAEKSARSLAPENAAVSATTLGVIQRLVRPLYDRFFAFYIFRISRYADAYCDAESIPV